MNQESNKWTANGWMIAVIVLLILLLFLWIAWDRSETSPGLSGLEAAPSAQSREPVLEADAFAPVPRAGVEVAPIDPNSRDEEVSASSRDPGAEGVFESGEMIVAEEAELEEVRAIIPPPNDPIPPEILEQLQNAPSNIADFPPEEQARILQANEGMPPEILEAFQNTMDRPIPPEILKDFKNPYPARQAQETLPE